MASVPGPSEAQSVVRKSCGRNDDLRPRQDQVGRSEGARAKSNNSKRIKELGSGFHHRAVEGESSSIALGGRNQLSQFVVATYSEGDRVHRRCHRVELATRARARSTPSWSRGTTGLSDKPEGPCVAPIARSFLHLSFIRASRARRDSQQAPGISIIDGAY